MIALVLKSTGSWYNVLLEGGEKIDCRIKGKFRIKGLKVTNPVAVGDRVEVELEKSTEDGKVQGVIHNILERKNYIIRKSVNLSKQYHIIASNIDQAILLVSIDFPVTTCEFIDRFLVSAQAYQIPTVIVINKMDLYGDAELKKVQELKKVYTDIGYPVVLTSVLHPENTTELKNLFLNKTSVVVGHSGVGKSSLLNLLFPNLKLKTSSISDVHGQGMHTTTFAEMMELDKNTYIIDTPGIKGLGVVDIQKEEISHFFPEFLSRIPMCQFNNCVHLKEPNCAIKAALEAGEIAASRYKSYLSIYNNDSEDLYR